MPEEPNEPPSRSGHFFAINTNEQGTSAYLDGEVVQTFQGGTGSVFSNKQRRKFQLNPDVLFETKLKIERAKRHIDEFEFVTKAYFDGNPYEIIHEIHPESGENVWRILVKEALPSVMSVIAGDAIHNLRTALDYLVCELIRANGREPHQNAGLTIKNRPENLKPGGIPKIQGISARAERYLLRLKGSNATNGALFVLSMLDVYDRHNTLVTVAGATVQITAKLASRDVHWTRRVLADARSRSRRGAIYGRRWHSVAFSNCFPARKQC